MIRKVLERRGGTPLLPLEQHGDERRGEDEGSGDLQPPGAEEMAAALPLGAVANLIVVLQVAEEVMAGEAGRRSAVSAIARTSCSALASSIRASLTSSQYVRMREGLAREFPEAARGAAWVRDRMTRRRGLVRSEPLVWATISAIGMSCTSGLGAPCGCAMARTNGAVRVIDQTTGGKSSEGTPA